MKIGITGGAGFIGRHLIRELSGRFGESKIRVLDTLDDQIHEGDSLLSFRREFPNVELRRGSVVEMPDCEWLVDQADIVFHLAAETGTGQSMYEISKYTETNVLGTAQLLQAILNRGSPLESFILASSRSIYGEGMYGQCGSCGHTKESAHQRYEKHLRKKIFSVRCDICSAVLPLIPTKEDCIADPRSYYALTKLNQEQQLRICADRVSKSSIIFRFQNVYGPGQSLKNPYTGILAIFSGLAKTGAPINVFEDGLESRDFIWVGDIVRVLVDSMLLKGDSEVVSLNLGTGISVPVIEVANKVNRFYGEKSQIKVSGDFRLGDIRHNMACMEAARKFGISNDNFVGFEKGLSEFLGLSNHADDGMRVRLDASFAEMKSFGLLISGD